MHRSIFYAMILMFLRSKISIRCKTDVTFPVGLAELIITFPVVAPPVIPVLIVFLRPNIVLIMV